VQVALKQTSNNRTKREFRTTLRFVLPTWIRTQILQDFYFILELQKQTTVFKFPGEIFGEGIKS